MLFRNKTQEHQKWRSSFHIVKYSVSWGSPCSKKRATLWKHVSFFSLIFHRFFVKKTEKNVQKGWTTALRAKSEENSRLERPFLAKKRFGVDFWGPSGSPGGSRDVPGASQNPWKFSLICSCVSKCARTVPREAPERPRGTPQAPPGHNFRSILTRFCMSKNVEKCNRMLKKHRKKYFKNYQ